MHVRRTALPTWYFDAVLTRAPRRFLPNPVTVSNGTTRGCLGLCKPRASASASPSPGIWCDDPGGGGGDSINACLCFLFSSCTLICEPLWLTHFALQSNFQLTPLGRCRIFGISSASLGDSSRRSRRYGAGSPRCRSLLSSGWAIHAMYLPFVPLVPGQGWASLRTGSGLKGFLVGKTHQSVAPGCDEHDYARDATHALTDLRAGRQSAPVVVVGALGFPVPRRRSFAPALRRRARIRDSALF